MRSLITALSAKRCSHMLVIFKYLNIEIFKNKKGVSTLPTMLLLGGIIIEIAIASAFLTYYFNVTNFSSRLAAEALAAARAGIDDAIIQVIRNKNFTAYPDPYIVTVSGGKIASVTVCRDTCVGSGKDQVVSTASILNKRSKVEAILSVSPEGKVTVDSIKEIPF